MLYVEDDSINAYVMKRFLKDLFIVEVVQDGESAVEMLKDCSFDVILLDINLGNGKMDGIQVLRAIQEKYDLKTPVLAITSFAMPGDEERFIGEGFDDYVSKPIEKDLIIGKINKFLHR